MPAQNDDRVLLDFRTSDDAGVYRWDEQNALVQTVDFFTPVVDDPATYGAIAAANSLSDVYAMGARPLTALAIAGFPQADLEEGTIRDIFRGGFHKLREAGVALLGGHTVQDREIKFGYAVTGVVEPGAVWSNGGARPGDVLLLTKPIGTGVVATAIKWDRAPGAAVDEATAVMLQLNKFAADVLRALPAGSVHGCTDITGFGLIGHASEMAAASGVTLRLRADALPLIAGALALVEGNRSGGMKTNEMYFARGVRHEREISPAVLALLYDPQTSGGLLAAVSEGEAEEAQRRLGAAGLTAAIIGQAEPFSNAAIVLV